MTIWALAICLFVIVGALGRQVGAIRMSISCAGAVLALFLSGPLSPHVRSVLGTVGVKDPVLTWALAAPLVFLAITLVFNTIAVSVYLKISGYYKHRAPDDVRMRWERLDGNLGLCVGLVAAVVYLIAGSARVGGHGRRLLVLHADIVKAGMARHGVDHEGARAAVHEKHLGHAGAIEKFGDVIGPLHTERLHPASSLKARNVSIM